MVYSTSSSSSSNNSVSPPVETTDSADDQSLGSLKKRLASDPRLNDIVTRYQRQRERSLHMDLLKEKSHLYDTNRLQIVSKSIDLLYQDMKYLVCKDGLSYSWTTFLRSDESEKWEKIRDILTSSQDLKVHEVLSDELTISTNQMKGSESLSKEHVDALSYFLKKGLSVQLSQEQHEAVMSIEMPEDVQTLAGFNAMKPFQKWATSLENEKKEVFSKTFKFLNKLSDHELGKFCSKGIAKVSWTFIDWESDRKVTKENMDEVARITNMVEFMINYQETIFSSTVDLTVENE